MKVKDFLTLTFFSMGLTLILWFLITYTKIMPQAASYEAKHVDGAFNAMLAVTVPIFALVITFVVYTLFRYSAGKDQSEGIKFYGSGNGIVEAAWIFLSLALTLGLAALGTKELFAIRGNDQADLNIQVKASQFSWEFYYPEQNIFSPELILPEGKRVRLLLSSEDVVHSFWVPEFRLKQDLLPGKVVKLLFTPSKLGQYTLFCSELCRSGHTTMTAPVRVVEKEQFAASIKEQSW